MEITPEEKPFVRRAVAAYRAKKRHEGPFKGTTADHILAELELSPARWSDWL